jgi:cellulose synthase/poly-beta-1,6-N-acetylglucosamine synthase-like glycosyltransferase
MNLLALIEQDYPVYEVIFVVDGKNDPAMAVIEEIAREAAKNAKKTKLIVAGGAVGCSQKVENLRVAVLHAADKSEAFVFVDSDARPSSEWLRYLVAPLQDKSPRRDRLSLVYFRTAYIRIGIAVGLERFDRVGVCKNKINFWWGGRRRSAATF